MKCFLRFVAVLGLLVGAGQAQAGTLFYGGDWYGNGTGGGTTTNTHRSDLEANVYQNFIVPTGQTWNISALFSNDLVEPVPSGGITGADWSIRSGVSAGNGGSVIAGGSNSAVTISPTGRANGAFLENTFAVAGLNITLSPGTYWVNVTPVLASTDGFTYNTLTFGSNSAGTHNSDDDFIFVLNSPTQNFQSLDGTYSDGVIGTANAPEPGSLTLLAVGIASMAGYGWRNWLPRVARRQLAEAERGEWQAFWENVEDLEKRAAAPPPQ